MSTETKKIVLVDLFYGESQLMLTTPLFEDDFKNFSALITKIRKLDPDNKKGSYTLELASKELKDIDYKDPKKLPFTFQANNTALIEDQRHLIWIVNNASNYEKLKIDIWKRIGQPQHSFDFDYEEPVEESDEEPLYEADFYLKKIEAMDHEAVKKLSKRQVAAWAYLCAAGVASIDEIPQILASKIEKKKIVSSHKRLGFPKSGYGKL